MAEIGNNVEEDLKILDVKIKQLKNEYEQYFLGNRPREPQVLRGEVQRIVAVWSNLPIQNTGMRFKFNNLRARFFSFRRHWDLTCRKIEEGRYERHVFKANLRGGPAKQGAGKGSKPDLHEAADPGLYEAYVSARTACGQNTAGLSPDKLLGMLRKQEESIRSKHGCGVKFRVVVEDGKAKLKASAVR